MKGSTSSGYSINPAWMLALLPIICVEKSLAFTIASQPSNHLPRKLELALFLSRSGSTRTSANLYYKKRLEDGDENEFIAIASIDSWLGSQEQEQERNHDDNISTTMTIMSHQHQQLLPSRKRGTDISHPLKAHALHNIRPMLADVFIRGRKGNHGGTKVHVAVLSVILASYVIFMRNCVGTRLCRAVMTMNSFALISDNFIMAMGKYIGEGAALRKLTKLRIIAHCLCTLTFLPIVEIVHKYGLASASLTKFIGCLVVGISVHEIFDWISFDNSKLILLDNRRSSSSTTCTMSGTMHYTSGRMVKMLLPVAILHLVILAVGSSLWSRGATAGQWMVVSGVLSLFIHSLRKPEIQALGESIFMSTLWFAVAQ